MATEDRSVTCDCEFCAEAEFERAETLALEATTFIFHPVRRPALTPLQQEAVNALAKLTRELGQSPSLSELAEYLHITIVPLWQRLRAAERKGYVTRRHGYARSLQVVAQEPSE